MKENEPETSTNNNLNMETDSKAIEEDSELNEPEDAEVANEPEHVKKYTEQNEPDAVEVITKATDIKESQIKIKFLSFLEELDKYSNLLVAFVTAILVIANIVLIKFNIEYIDLTQSIAIETKRLADISVEQFKIKSYPTFLIEKRKPSYENEIYKDEFNLINKGEISSFNTSVLTLYGYEVDRTYSVGQSTELQFSLFTDYIYNYYGNENLSATGNSAILPAESKLELSTTIKVKEGGLNRLKYSLTFIKFKVPYDDLFRYEIFVHSFKISKQDNGKQVSCRWNITTDSMKTELIEDIINSKVKIADKEDKIKNFLQDYPNISQVKFSKI